MKKMVLSVLFTATTSFSMTNTQEAKTWVFSYKSQKTQTFQIKKTAPSYEVAFKAAAKDCYQQMTQGKYPGEEKGLEIIDICANPKS